MRFDLLVAVAVTASSWESRSQEGACPRPYSDKERRADRAALKWGVRLFASRIEAERTRAAGGRLKVWSS